MLTVRMYCSHFFVSDICEIIYRLCDQLKLPHRLAGPFLPLLHWSGWNDDKCTPHRGTATILNSCGECVKPRTPSMLGFTPSAGVMLKRCKRVVKNRKSSILASGSPMHTRLPALERKLGEKKYSFVQWFFWKSQAAVWKHGCDCAAQRTVCLDEE